MNNAEQPWQLPPTDLRLMENEVHVWRIPLEIPTSGIERFLAVLVDEEIRKAKKFYFEKDRRHWIVAHAVLRLLLGRYLNLDPRSPRFRTNDYGKPFIIDPPEGVRLHFNLSHSRELALCAFTHDRHLGVDIEYMCPGIEYKELAAAQFSARECETLHALPAALQEEAFFLCWTRKEAYIKTLSENR